MFSNVLMTALTPLCNTDENSSWQNRPFTGDWPENQQTFNTTQMIAEPRNPVINRTIKKKKRHRTAFNTDQLLALEHTFARAKYITGDMRSDLAKSLNIGERCIKIWFQNRRMKEKKESYESSDGSETSSVMEELPVGLPTLQEIANGNTVPQVLPYNHTYSQIGAVGDNQFYMNQLTDVLMHDLSNQLCDRSESNRGVAEDSPTAEPFADDRSTYPTSYFPTLADYFSGRSYQYDTQQYDSSSTISAETQQYENNATETQQYEPSSINATETQWAASSVNSAETQQYQPSSINATETQWTANSVNSAETQQYEPNGVNTTETQWSVSSVNSAETQQYETSSINATETQWSASSVNSPETQQYETSSTNPTETQWTVSDYETSGINATEPQWTASYFNFNYFQ
ncbi:protein zerknuellt 1-like [Ostrinia furnacalis]|uniref:protein zerknuellt 1-like n=1 Tax=Ostrinia furnacalis TaxID=93504 RepID=UPI001038FAD0|nr:protein zerknuellt 1-like [Ostrinia furnacalis]